MFILGRFCARYTNFIFICARRVCILYVEHMLFCAPFHPVLFDLIFETHLGTNVPAVCVSLRELCVHSSALRAEIPRNAYTSLSRAGPYL